MTASRQDEKEIQCNPICYHHSVDKKQLEHAGLQVAADGESRALQQRLHNNQALLRESEASLTAAGNKEQELHLKVTKMDVDRVGFEHEVAQLKKCLTDAEVTASPVVLNLALHLINILGKWSYIGCLLVTESSTRPMCLLGVLAGLLYTEK